MNGPSNGPPPAQWKAHIDADSLAFAKFWRRKQVPTTDEVLAELDRMWEHPAYDHMKDKANARAFMKIASDKRYARFLATGKRR